MSLDYRNHIRMGKISERLLHTYTRELMMIIDFILDLYIFVMSILFIWLGIKIDKESYKENRMFMSLFSFTGLFPFLLTISYYLFRIFMIGLGVILLYLLFTGGFE
jgi:hypothetical protein